MTRSVKNVLRCEFYFELPDDFEGTRADAIRLLADYDEATEDAHSTTMPPDEFAVHEESPHLLWGTFLDRGAGKRLVGHLDHQEFDGRACT